MKARHRRGFGRAGGSAKHGTAFEGVAASAPTFYPHAELAFARTSQRTAA